MGKAANSLSEKDQQDLESSQQSCPSVLLLFLKSCSNETDLCPNKGWRQGRARGSIVPSEHASPPSEGEKRFFRRFLAIIVP